jgi:hypothetical protein
VSEKDKGRRELHKIIVVFTVTTWQKAFKINSLFLSVNELILAIQCIFLMKIEYVTEINLFCEGILSTNMY